MSGTVAAQIPREGASAEQPLRIGRLRIWPPVVLAPMSALTNLPMRSLAEEQGCGLTITEFLPAAALSVRNHNVLRRLTPSRDQRAFGVQIYGRDPRQMERAAALAVEAGAALVDINMGCPAKKVTRGVCGAALMREPALAADLVRAVVEGVAGRAEVTVKMRAGWDARERNAPELASLMVEAGAQAVTVHGRTRQQRFSGAVDREIIARVKRAVAVPVIANGDVVDVASADRLLRATGADAVMVGRGALGNPWLFAALRAHFGGEVAPPPPSREDRVRMYLRHLDQYLEIADERRAVFEMRKFAVWYLGPLPDGEQIRQRINRMADVASIRALLAEKVQHPDHADHGSSL